MSKLTNVEMCALLTAKGLTIGEDNPNLVTICRSLGVLPEILHEATVVHNVPKQGMVDVPTDKSKSYLAVSGGARGRDAWFPIPKGAKVHIASMAAALAELADSMPDPE